MLYQIREKLLFRLIVLFCISSSIYCSNSFADERLSSKSWYKNAEEYIRYDSILIQHAKEKKANFLEDYESRHKAEIKLLNSKLPTKDDLRNLLMSKTESKIKVALVVIMLKHIDEESLFRIILNNINTSTDYLLRFYTYQSLSFLSIHTVKQLEDDTLTLLSSDTDNSLIIAAMPSLIKMTPSKVLPFFVNYLESTDKGLKMAAYIHLKKMGKQYLTMAKESLKKANAVEALNFIRNAETGEKP